MNSTSLYSYIRWLWLQLILTDKYRDKVDLLWSKYHELVNNIDVDGLKELKGEIDELYQEINRYVEPKTIKLYDEGRAIKILVGR